MPDDAAANHLEPDPPEYDADSFGPEYPDDYIILTPDERPFTVLVFDPDSVFAGGSWLHATGLIYLHATTAEEAANRAIDNLRTHARSNTWRQPEIFFVTEGFHEDLGPGKARRVI